MANEAISKAGWKIVLLASLGGTLEFYDFVIFGVFGADLGRAIFPSSVPLVELLSSYGVFAAGYFARPIGGVVLSHFGDRYGRRNVFLLSLFAMSGATLCMGLVPTYASWGLAASVTMVFLRLLQGFCIGGELPGALTYVVETAPKQAALVCGVVFACVTYGVAVATGVSVGVRTFLPPELVPEYGWRIAFMLGGLGGIISFLARRAMEESPEFEKMKALAARQPFREVLQAHRGAVLTGIGILALSAGFNGLYFSHMPGYLGRVLGYDARSAVVAATIGVVIHATMIAVVGWVARWIAPLTLLRVGALGLLVFGYPFYTALAAKPASPVALLVGIGLLASFINGTYAVLLTDLFPTRIRFSGVALAFNISFTLFSGTAPLIATWLIGRSGASDAPALILVACALMTLVASFLHPRYSGHVLAGRGSELASRS